MALLTNINGKFSVSDAGAVTFNNAFTFPTTDGTANYVLKTNGSGTVSWSPDSSPTVYWAASGNNIYNTNSGQVSIGSTYVSGVATRVLTVDDASNAAIVIAHNGATALSLYADGDEANIGSYLAGANMKFFTTPSGGGTTERMRIDSSGNVGIGTSSPDRLLEISHDAASHDPVLRLTGTNTGAFAAGIEWQSGFGPKTSAQIFSTASGSQGGELWINVRDQATNALVRRMYFKNDGNVGVGTSSPEQKLHVEGASITVNRGNDDSSIAFQNSTSGATWRIGRDYSNSEALTFAYSATDYPSLTGNGLISIDTSGNVGIGVAPTFKLDVESDTDSLAGAYIQAGKSSQGEIQNTGLIVGSRTDTATGDYLGISFSGNAAVPARARAAIGAVSINGASGMDLVFMTRNAGDGSQLGTGDEKMRITSGGNVGIGTSSPNNFSNQTSLTVSGTSIGRVDVQVTGGAGGGIYGSSSQMKMFANYGMNLALESGTGGVTTFATNGTERMRITSGGTIQMTDENGGVPILQVRNFATTATGAFTNAYAMEFRGATTGGSTGGMMLLHMNEANDTRPTLNVSDSNGIFATFTNGKVGIGTTSPGNAKLYVNGGTTLGGSNNTDAGATRIFGDVKRPQANYFVKRNYNLAAGASGTLYSIARQWHDHANWGLGNINVIMWGIYYGQGQFNKADFSCRYGYGGGGADVQANFNTNGMAQPAWTAATLVSGNTHYRDLQIQIPAYHQISFEIISPGLQQTYNLSNQSGNSVYLYPH